MKFSENWLRTFVDPELSTDALAHLLTMSGLEVETIEAAAPAFDKVVVAQVLEVSRHPNADRLNVCKVDIGTGIALNIVCGALNVRPGIKVPCALVGAELPGITISQADVRGVESSGMLCSAKELQIAEDADGLLELPEDAPVGDDIRAYLDLDDALLTLKLTPNRADCLSVLGVAREVSALTGKTLTLPPMTVVAPTLDEKIPVRIEASDLCGRFAGRVIRGLNAAAPTPEWMKRRLERSGQRPISALVDISNYVMLELGRPSHVFDLDKIQGDITVRWGRAGETLKLLNGETVSIDEHVGVVVAGRKIESLAGIMGGDAAAVSLETTNIYLEAAFWWPEAIQGRARRYNFSTDAAHRFERGVDFATTVMHLERISTLIVEICGTGKTGVGPVDDNVFNLPKRAPVRVRTNRAARIIGIPLVDADIAKIFSRLGFIFTQEKGALVVTPPSHRFDIQIEEDLIEEIARMHGFENIPVNPPRGPQTILPLNESRWSLSALKHTLADRDYQEVINYSFVDAAWETDFCNNADPIRLANPIASQMSVMRTSLLGGLVANLVFNLNRKQSRVRVFEVGRCYFRDGSVVADIAHVAGFAQPMRIGGLAYGFAVSEQWGEPARRTDFFDVKADIEALLYPLALEFAAPAQQAAHPGLHPGRMAVVSYAGHQIGWIGELHPKLQQKYDLPTPPVVFELDVNTLQAAKKPAYTEFSKLPLVIRDLAVVVDEKIEVGAVLASLEKTRTNRVQSVTLFDLYRGKGLPEGKKSLAFRVVMQDTEKTMTDQESDAEVARMVLELAAFGATLRA